MYIITWHGAINQHCAMVGLLQINIKTSICQLTFSMILLA